jgi:hypothetical protein
VQDPAAREEVRFEGLPVLVEDLKARGRAIGLQGSYPGQFGGSVVGEEDGARRVLHDHRLADAAHHRVHPALDAL